MAINYFSIRPEVTMVSRFWNSVITWLPSSWETWRNSRQCTVKRHLWRLLEQHWPPWARVRGRWGSRFPGDVWDVLYTMVYWIKLVYWIILVYWYTSMFGRFVWENFAPLDLRENCFWHQICVKQNQHPKAPRLKKINRDWFFQSKQENWKKSIDFSWFLKKSIEKKSIVFC